MRPQMPQSCRGVSHTAQCEAPPRPIFLCRHGKGGEAGGGIDADKLACRIGGKLALINNNDRSYVLRNACAGQLIDCKQGRIRLCRRRGDEHIIKVCHRGADKLVLSFKQSFHQNTALGIYLAVIGNFKLYFGIIAYKGRLPLVAKNSSCGGLYNLADADGGALLSAFNAQGVKPARAARYAADKALFGLIHRVTPCNSVRRLLLR